MADWTSIDTLTRQFELCGVANGCDAVVVADASTPADLIDTATVALQRAGARGAVVILPATDADAGLQPSIRAGLRNTRCIIDCTGSAAPLPKLFDARAAEISVLTIGPRSSRGLDRWAPHPGLTERVARGEALLDEHAEVELTSDGGSALLLDVSEADVDGNSGVLTPGVSSATWPGGSVSTSIPAIAARRSTNRRAARGGQLPAGSGTIVLMPGDINVSFGEVIHSPVSLTIEQNRIAEIDGESGDADFLRAYLESFDSEDAYRLIRLTLGLNHAAGRADRFARGADGDAIGALAAGQISIGVGVPTAVGDTTDGPDPIDGHRGLEPLLTLGLRRTSLRLDGIRLVDFGSLTGELAPDVYELAAGGS